MPNAPTPPAPKPKRKATTANNEPTAKAKPRGKPWPKGVSGNPKGAPKRGESWQEIIKRVGELTPPEAAARSLELSKQLLKIGDGLTLKEAVVLRVYGALLFEPQASLLNAFMDRAEGKVADKMTVSWEDKAREDGFDPDEIKKQLREQFLSAMVSGRGDGSVSGSEDPSDLPA